MSLRQHLRRVTLIGAAAAMMAACGEAAPTADASTGGGDGGSDVEGVAPPAEPAPPVLPTPPDPVRLDCPTGWTVRPAADPAEAEICLPFPDDAMPDCAAGTLPVPGMSACATVGPPCPAGDGFPDPAPAPSAIYVRAGATGGTGSRASPLGSLGDAVAGAPSGAVLVLAAGRYGSVEVAGDLSLFGACAAEVEILGSAGGAALSVTGGAVSVSGLTLTADAAGTAVDQTGGDLSLEGVETAGDVTVGAGQMSMTRVALRGGELAVESAARLDATEVFIANPGATGLRVSGGTAEVADLAIRDVGLGIEVGGAGALTARRTVIQTAERQGITVTGAQGTFEDAVILDVGDSTIQVGAGATVSEAGTLILRRMRVERAGLQGVTADDAGSTADIAGLVVRSLGGPGVLSRGQGLYVGHGAHADGVEVSLEDAQFVGLHVYQASGHFRNLSVIGVRPDSAGIGGHGIVIASGQAVFDRVLVRGAHVTGVYTADPAAKASLRDVTVRELEPREMDGKFGRGVTAAGGAKVLFERLLIEDVHSRGVFIMGLGASVAGEDLTVRRVVGDPAALFPGLGIGIDVQEHGLLDLRRGALEDTVGIGALVHGEGASTRIRDLRILRVESMTAEPVIETLLGRGFETQVGGTADVERLVVETARDSGISVSEGTMVVRDARVVLTRDDGVVGLEGRGMHANGGSLDVQRAVIVDNRHSGLAGFRDAMITGRDIEIVRTERTTCADAGCDPGGVGVGAYGRSSIDLERFRIADNLIVGVQVANEAGIDLRDGEVSGSPIGVNVQVDDYDLARLTDRVRYIDNGINLDSAVLPIPDAPASIDAVGEAGM